MLPISPRVHLIWVTHYKYPNVILLLTFAFALQCLANQETSEIIRSTILRQNLSDKNLRLDPLLRKALLKALVELEKEAEEKLRAEETRNIRSEPSDSIGNFVQSVEEDKQEVPGPAETAFPVPRANAVNQGAEEPRNNIQSVPNRQENQNAQNVQTVHDPVQEIDQTKIQNDLQYSTTPSIPEEISNLVETSKSQDTIIQSSIESNFIPDDINKGKNVVEGNELNSENKKQEEGNKEGKQTEVKGNEVDIFKAPLVAAFTLHQDSKGTPHSVIPLFSKQQQISNQQRQQFLEHQYALYKQQQQQQYLQNQFIPSVTLTPFSPHINQFDQSRYFITGAPNFSPSTGFPPLVTNSIIPQSFNPIPTPAFDATTLPPFKASQPNFLANLPPQRNFSPEPFGQTILPGQDFNGVSVVQSHSINLTPAPQTFPLPTVTPSPRLQPLNIPPVTLPLQNEARFQTPIIVPSVQQNPNQAFLDSQEQERIRNRILAEEQNRKRLIEEQNRQRQIQEQNRQRQLEEERQRQIYESQIRLRQQRQEQGVDFQRSVGFTFNQNTQSFRPSSFRSHQNGFNFHIQPSQSFVSSVNFVNPLNHNRVNRQEGFASTGNFGFNNNNQGNRNFDNRFQYQSNQIYTKIPEYRTIPDEHYRNLQINQFQQNNRFQQYNQQQQQQQQQQYLQQQQQQQYQQQQYQQQQYQQQFNNFGRNNVDDVNKRLQSLLYQSGVAADASGQEDLNIVSKVLALNHERSDSNVSETVLQNSQLSESPKSLAVGEIKEAETTTE